MNILIVLASVVSVALAINGECGVPAITPSTGTYVVGGKDAIPGSFPWQANLRTAGNGYQFCGGSLIHPQFVLTAGHCFYVRNGNYKPGDYEVGLGFHHVDGSGDSHAKKVGVKNIIVHENYNDWTLSNDVCLLQLSTPVTYDNYIDEVCLPDGPIADGENTYITGWGDAEKIINPKNLQQATVPIINRDTCNSASWYNGEIEENMICAGFEQGGIDTCQGDSGGPLVYQHNDHFEQHGITSWGYGCADPRNPGVYAEVWDFVPWINQKIAQYGG